MEKYRPSNQRRVEAIVVRPFAGADGIVRQIGDRFFTTEGRLEKYASRKDTRGRNRPLAVLYKENGGNGDGEKESGLKSINRAPENKAVFPENNKGVSDEPRKRRGRPKGSKNKR